MALLERLVEDAARIARDVAVDLGPEMDVVAVEVIVRRYLDAVASGGRLAPGEIARLRTDGAAAARAGRPLAEPLDAWLSTGWVAWDHAVRIAGTRDAAGLATLGAVLLRAGDDVAAALADGYTAAERALAARAGATRRAVVDELLSPLRPGSANQARRTRLAALVGLDAAAPHGLLVARSTGELEEEGPAADEVARRLGRDPARRPHLVSVRDGDLVVVLAGPWRTPSVPERALAGFGDAGDWWAASVAPGDLLALPRAYLDALDALRVLPACRPPGGVTPADAVALERALVADAALTATGVESWLGTLDRAGRGSAALVPTLEAWLAEGRSVTAAARRLAIAPRTVSYRLDRIARLLGVTELDPATVERLTTALLARRLLRAWGAPAGRA